jgi:hypothetical protein
MKTQIRLFMKNFKARFSESEGERAFILFVIEVTLILLLCATVVLVYFVDTNGRPYCIY